MDINEQETPKEEIQKISGSATIQHFVDMFNTIEDKNIPILIDLGGNAFEVATVAMADLETTIMENNEAKMLMRKGLIITPKMPDMRVFIADALNKLASEGLKENASDS